MGSGKLLSCSCQEREAAEQVLLPLPHFLQQLVIANEALYNFYLFDFGSFFFFLFKLYKAFHLQSVFIENTPASPPYTISLFIMRAPPALAREIKKH